MAIQPPGAFAVISMVVGASPVTVKPIDVKNAAAPPGSVSPSVPAPSVAPESAVRWSVILLIALSTSVIDAIADATLIEVAPEV